MQEQWLPASLFASVWSDEAITYQKIDPQKLKDKVFFCPSQLPQAVVSCSWNRDTAACRVTGGGGWVAATVGKSWKLTIIYLPNLLLELASLQQTQEFQISYRFWKCNCCLGRQSDSWCFLSWHFPRILPQLSFKLMLPPPPQTKGEKSCIHIITTCVDPSFHLVSFSLSERFPLPFHKMEVSS